MTRLTFSNAAGAHPAPGRRDRRGIALAATLLALVVIGALIAGAFFASTQEFRVGRNTLASQRAFAVAEFGLNAEIAGWDRKRYLPGSSTYMNHGDVDDKPRFIADGDTAHVKVTRLNENTFWLVSEGGASMGSAQVKAVQRTSAIVRIAYPSVSTRGALTTAGRVDINGSAKIYGNDMSASNDKKIEASFNSLNKWGQCSSIGSASIAGISMPPDTSLKEKANAIVGTPNVDRNVAAAADSTYIKFGDENWLSLAANADVRYTGTTSFAPAPVGTATTCTLTDTTNFGEPWRAGEKSAHVAGCTSYFPIVYIDGDAHFNGGRGQGVLMVNGDLAINGGFQWYGLILVKETIKSNGTADVFGAVMSQAAKLDVNDNNSTSITGDQNIWYSKCAVESALRGSAILVPVHQRAWAQFF
jgi:hypothetical protein